MVKHITDESNRRGWRISEAKRDNHPLINPKVSFEVDLLGINGSHANLMIASNEIHFSEILGSMQLTEHVIYMGKWIVIFDSIFVEGSIVCDQMPFNNVLFRNNEGRGST